MEPDYTLFVCSLHIMNDTQQTAHSILCVVQTRQQPNIAHVVPEHGLAAGMIQVPCMADNTQQWEGLYYPVSFCTHSQDMIVNCTLFTLLLQCSVGNSLLFVLHQ